MMLEERIQLLVRLGAYMKQDSEWETTKLAAGNANPWFIKPFVDLACSNIIDQFLDDTKLRTWVSQYDIPVVQPEPKTVGLVMAGNLPLVGFHDFLCVFISGHRVVIKPSSKDNILIRKLVDKLYSWNNEVSGQVFFAEQLKGCDAYIATGSNNSGRYFEYYFRNYPSIIRKNRTSAAVLTGHETVDELEKLADDMLLYFGFGCRNVSKIYVPQEYQFTTLLEAINRYSWIADHNKYKNNYDYNLSLLILNNRFYMTEGTILLVENESLFSPISQIHYSYYNSASGDQLLNDYPEALQCVISASDTPFGSAQAPALNDYADGVDTMRFLTSL